MKSRLYWLGITDKYSALAGFWSSHVLKQATVTLFLAVLQFPLFAVNHYIRAGATGSNDGSSWANAWTNFNAVTWTRGDMYFLAGGSYGTNAILSNREPGTNWIVVKKANAADNSKDAGWNAVFATTQSVVDGRVTIDSAYWEIDGVTGSGESGHGIKFQDLDMQGMGTILFYGAGPLYLHHLELRNGLHRAPTGIDVIWDNINVKKGWHISNCWIHECSKDGLSLNNLQGMSWSDYGLLFENNVLSETGGALNGDHGQGMKFQSNSSYLLFRNNVFRNSTGTAVVAFLGTNQIFANVQFYNNVFYKNNLTEFPTISPAIIYGRNSVTCSNFLVANNTFWGFGNSSNVNTVAQIALDGMVSGNSLVNNVWENSYFTSSGHRGFATNAYNAYCNISGSAVSAVIAGQIAGTATAFLVPGINFNLRSNAYVIGAGGNMGNTFTTDSTGKPRLGAWDIGAYQHQVGAPPARPTGLKVQSVGP